MVVIILLLCVMLGSNSCIILIHLIIILLEAHGKNIMFGMSSWILPIYKYTTSLYPFICTINSKDERERDEEGVVKSVIKKK